MTKKRMLAAIISVLALSGVVGANLATAGSPATDKHEDVGENADHQCPPDCDTANGETP